MELLTQFWFFKKMNEYEERNNIIYWGKVVSIQISSFNSIQN